MIMIVCYLLLALLLPGLTSAQATPKANVDGVYRGTLGQHEIAMEMGAPDPNRSKRAIEGRYFYRSHGVAIPLEGAFLPDKSLRLREIQNGRPSGAEWRLTVTGNKATGFFCKCDLTKLPTQGKSPKKLPIELVRISSGFDQNMLLGVNPAADDKAYYDLLLDFPLENGPEMRVGEDMAYVMQTDPRFKVGLPHLTRFPDAGVMAKVNEDLTQELNQRRIGVADCFYQAGQAGEDWEEEDRVTLLTRDVLSIIREGSNYCGGAHPNSIMEPLLYNLHTGKAFDLRELLRVESQDGLAKDGAVPNAPEYQFLADLYLKGYPKRTDCTDVVSLEAYQAGDLRFLMYLNAKGLVLIPDLPHVVTACAEAVEIPYSQLPNVRTDGPFKSLLEKQN